MNTNTPELLQRISALGASDLFIIAGRPLSYRLNDQVVQDDSERLLPDDTRQLIEDIYHLAGERDMDTLNQTGDDDFPLRCPASHVSVSAPINRGDLLQRSSVSLHLHCPPRKKWEFPTISFSFPR